MNKFLFIKVKSVVIALASYAVLIVLLTIFAMVQGNPVSESLFKANGIVSPIFNIFVILSMIFILLRHSSSTRDKK